jgi:hypothetical protein
MAQARVDPYQFESGTGYDPVCFYTRSVDKQGHSDYIRLPLRKGTLGAISELIRQPQLAVMKTPQDFIRNAIVHALHRYRREIEEGMEVGDQAAEALSANSFYELREQLEQRRRLLGDIDQTLEENRRHRTGLEQVLERAQMVLETWRETPGQQYAAELAEVIDRYTPQLRRVK